MFQQDSQAAYLAASAEGATQIGLYIVVHNALAGDLLRAGEACRAGDIATRCSASNRALLLIGHLEQWTSYLDDDHLTDSLRSFYSNLRSTLVALQAKGGPDDFFRLSQSVQSVRSAWQTKENILIGSRAVPQSQLQARPHESFDAFVPQIASAWSA